MPNAADTFASRLLSLSAAEWAAIGARFLAEVDDERGPVDVAREIERAGLGDELERLAERVGPHVMRMESVERAALGGLARDDDSPDESEALRSVALHAAMTALGALMVRDRLAPGALSRIYAAFEPSLPLRELIGREEAARAAGGGKAVPPGRPPAGLAAEALFGEIATRVDAGRARSDAAAADAFVARLEAPGDDSWLASTALCLDPFALVEKLDGADLPEGLTYDALAAAGERHLERAAARAGAGEAIARLEGRLADRAGQVDWSPLARLGAYSGASRGEMGRIAARAAGMAAAALRLRGWLSPRAFELAYAPFERALPLSADPPAT